VGCWFDSNAVQCAHIQPLTLNPFSIEINYRELATGEQQIHILNSKEPHLPHRSTASRLKCVASTVSPGGEILNPFRVFLGCRGEASEMVCAHFFLGHRLPDLLHLAHIFHRIHLLNMSGLDIGKTKRFKSFT
jgi:hypothetical protein